MTDDTPLPFDLPSVRRKKLTVEFAGGNQSSNGGLLLLREAERKHGVCLRLAEAMPDRRDPDRIRHAMFEMVMSRVLAIACGHEDAIDLDRLRHDPLMKLAVGRCPESAIGPSKVGWPLIATPGGGPAAIADHTRYPLTRNPVTWGPLHSPNLGAPFSSGRRSDSNLEMSESKSSWFAWVIGAQCGDSAPSSRG